MSLTTLLFMTIQLSAEVALATPDCSQVTIRANTSTCFMQLLPELVILPPSSAAGLLQVMHRNTMVIECWSSQDSIYS